MILNELINVLLSILIASAIGAILIFLFTWVGEYYALDERIFPKVTAKQRAIFGFIGFYLLVLTGLEVLNPQSLESLHTGLGITFKPSILGIPLVSGVTLQDIISLLILGGFLLWFYINTQRISKRVQPITGQKTSSAPHLQRKGSQQEWKDMETILKEKTRGLSLSFNFSALSFLIALIAPVLANPILSNLGLIVILGVFLVSGIYCFIEAMKLGAWFAGYPDRTKLRRWVVIHVIVAGIIYYILIGAFGFVFYTLFPRLFAGTQGNELGTMPDLVRSTTKIIAGAFVILAAYLVAWEGQGLIERLIKFMVLVSVSPIVLPVWRMGWKVVAVDWLGAVNAELSDPTNPATIGYMIILLITPLVAYYLSSKQFGSSPLRRKVAYVERLAWAPFVVSTTPKSFDYEYQGYSTAEELLEDVIGQTARTGRDTLFPMSPKIRHAVAAVIGLHKDYDAIVIDLISAIRLIDAVQRQERHITGKQPSSQYFIVAGICQTKQVCLRVKPESDSASNVLVGSGPPYLEDNRILTNHTIESLSSVVSNQNPNGITYLPLPPNCVADFFPERISLVVLPEPFATDVKSKLQQRRIYPEEVQLPESMAWRNNRYDVLLVRNLNDRDFIKELIDSLANGIQVLRGLKGPTMLEDTVAPAIAVQLDPRRDRKLETHSVTAALSTDVFNDAAIIEYGNPRGRANWEYVRDCLERLRELGVVELSEGTLRNMCVCGVIANMDMGRPATPASQSVVNLSVLQVVDEAGRLRDVLKVIADKSIDLEFLIAQRSVGGKRGFIYLLPKDAQALSEMQDWKEIAAISKGTVGVIPIVVADEVGALEKLLGKIADHQINVDSCFAFSRDNGQAIVLLSVDQKDMERAARAISEAGYDILGHAV